MVSRRTVMKRVDKKAPLREKNRWNTIFLNILFPMALDALGNASFLDIYPLVDIYLNDSAYIFERTISSSVATAKHRPARLQLWMHLTRRNRAKGVTNHQRDAHPEAMVGHCEGQPTRRPGECHLNEFGLIE